MAATPLPYRRHFVQAGGEWNRLESYMRTLAAILIMTTPTIGHAGTQYWEYGDWQVIVEIVDTGQDLRVNCTALTGGDGDPSLRIEVSNGDAGPPNFYPNPTLKDVVIRGYPTQLKEGQHVVFKVDDGTKVSGSVISGSDENGFPWVVAEPNQKDSLRLLKAMQRSNQVSFIVEGKPFCFNASLAGFTASYGKIAEQCEFPTVGIIE